MGGKAVRTELGSDMQVGERGQMRRQKWAVLRLSLLRRCMERVSVTRTVWAAGWQQQCKCCGGGSGISGIGAAVW